MSLSPLEGSSVNHRGVADGGGFEKRKKFKAAALYSGSQDGDSDTPGGEPVATDPNLIEDPPRQVEQSVAEGEPVATPE